METISAKTGAHAMPKRAKRETWVRIRKDWDLCLLLIPGLAFLFIFKYTPMYGLLIAFQDYSIFRGIKESPWVGWKHFECLIESDQFVTVLSNTIIISLYKLIFLFPLPIVVAILLNELRKMLFKRVIQSIIYLPHFIS